MSHIVNVQTEDFDSNWCFKQLRDNPKNGAIVTFTGIVRDFSANTSLAAIELEQYPKMTLHAMKILVEKAELKFGVSRIILIHRVGKIQVNEQIVFVGVSSMHRQGAFDAAQYIMDKLKNDVPLWKKEIDLAGNCKWVEAKSSDKKAGNQWD